ncbi:MAG: hypothetical protein EXR69_01860 [Myxococcales bacterium]|nr:hypothetical protein [Myxococcales bacterium]
MLLLLLVLSSNAEPVDRLLYAVGERIVTAGDLAFELDLDEHDVSPILALEVPEYSREQRLVDMTVVRALAGDTVVYRPTADEVEARWMKVRATWSRPEEFEAFLERWGMDGEALRGFLYSRMVVDRYIRRVAGSAEAPVDSAAFVPVYTSWMAEVRQRVLVRRAP